MRGDEHQKYAVSVDGYTLLNNSDGWWYASSSENGEVQKSEFRLMPDECETEALKKFKQTCPKGLQSGSLGTNTVLQSIGVQRRNVSISPIVGERRALVILMQYKDRAFKKTNEDFNFLFNELDYHKDGATGSVRDFYRFASQGQFDFITDVYGPYTSKYNMSYYGSNSSLGGNDSHAVDLCKEAMLNLPKDINFSIYDNDNDGLIDNVHIIFAGYGEEAGASSDAIWSHEHPHRVSLKNEIGCSLAGYSCSPELRGNRGNNISHIGVVCHELGHSLGAMDYYDTNYGTGGEYFGTGDWDVMAGGSWNDDGRTPPNFNPYVRSVIFGWNKLEVLASNQQYTMPRMGIDNPDLSIIYKLETGNDGDYFLLENRQQHYFDEALPGSGLMIYHVHPNIDTYNKMNTINATHPQGLYPVCASYSEPLKKKYGNINTAECPFPGIKKVKTFSPNTTPAAVAWNGSSAIVSLYNITVDESLGDISFTTSEETVIEPEEPDTPSEKNLVYRESFETSINDKMSISSIMGKEKWRTYKKGNFVINADLIPKANDGSGILMLFSAKDNAISESEADNIEIVVETGKNYYLTFDYYSVSFSNSDAPSFTLYAEDKYGEYKIFSISENTNEWRTIELPLVFADETFRYKFYGIIRSGGIFIDNVRLYKEEDVQSIKGTNALFAKKVKIYKSDGSIIKNQDSVSSYHYKGINIIRDKGGKNYKVISR